MKSSQRCQVFSPGGDERVFKRSCIGLTFSASSERIISDMPVRVHRRRRQIGVSHRAFAREITTVLCASGAWLGPDGRS